MGRSSTGKQLPHHNMKGKNGWDAFTSVQNQSRDQSKKVRRLKDDTIDQEDLTELTSQDSLEERLRFAESMQSYE